MQGRSNVGPSQDSSGTSMREIHKDLSGGGGSQARLVLGLSCERPGINSPRCVASSEQSGLRHGEVAILSWERCGQSFLRLLG